MAPSSFFLDFCYRVFAGLVRIVRGKLVFGGCWLVEMS